MENINNSTLTINSPQLTKESELKTSSYLEDVAFIRIVLIGLMVYYHAFCPFTGNWQSLQGEVILFSPYWWIGKTAYSFMLEAFVFISGLIFGCQILGKGVKNMCCRFQVVSKFKRLIYPSLLFSALYVMVFPQPVNIRLLYSIANGVGHMWFLPMLFWCFLITMVLERSKLTEIQGLMLCLGFSFVSFLNLPFQLNWTLYYIVFFYFGVLVGKGTINFNQWFNPKKVALLAALFILTFVASQYLKVYLSDTFYDGNTLMVRKLMGGGKICADRLLTLTYSTLGLLALYSAVNWLLSTKRIKLTPGLKKLNTYCLGVYLFQQFILKTLYYKYPVNEMLAIEWIPWVSFVLALLASLFLTHLFLKTKLG